MKLIHANDPNFNEQIERHIPHIRGAGAFYSALFHQYQSFYLAHCLVEDLSFFAYSDDGRFVAYAPLFLCRVNDQLEFSSAGNHTYAPIFALPQSARNRSGDEKQVFEEIERLAQLKGAKCHKASIEPYEILSGKSYYNYLREYGYADESSTILVIDLKRELAALWLEVRKSYRPLISKSKTKYQTIRVDHSNWNQKDCEKYRELHALAADRATRPLETFLKMYEMIQKDQAFLVGVKESSGEWMGAYFFYRYNGYVRYASGATHPKLPSSEGVGHLGLWYAVEYSHERGDHFFELGWQPFVDEMDITEKIRAISLFKSGFGGEKVSWFRGTKKF